MDVANREVDMKFQDPLSVELVKNEYEIFLRARAEIMDSGGNPAGAAVSEPAAP